MANAGTVNVNLVARTEQFERGMRTALGTLGSLGSTLGMLKGLAAGFLAWKGGEFIRGTMDSIDSQAKLADRLGTSTEAMIGLTHAGDLAGVSGETLAASLEKMSRNLADAERGAKPINDALQQMGLGIKDLRGLTPDEQLGKIADGLQTVGTAGQRGAIAVDLFGKSGAAMTTILADGSQGLRDMAKDAEGLGLMFSRMDAAKVEQANDAMSRVAAMLRGGFQQAAIAISPVLEAISNSLVQSAQNAGGFGTVVGKVLDAVKVGLGTLGDAWNVVMTGWHAGKSVAYGVAAAWTKAGEWISTVIVGIMGSFRSLGTLAGAVFDNIIAANNVTSAWLKERLGAAIQWVGTKLSDFLNNTAQALKDTLPATAATLNEAMWKVRSGVNGMAGETKAALQAAQTELDDTKARIASSWSNLSSDTKDHPLVKWFRESSAEMVVAGEQSAMDFASSFKAVLGQEASEGIANWFADIERMSEINAQAAAARTAARLKADAEAGLQHVDTLSAQELSLTNMFGNQADKQAAWDKKSWEQKLSHAKNFFGDLSTLQNSSSKRLFQIGKAAAIANAIVTTAGGIARQFLDLPIWAAIPAAAAVAAAGAVQIATISSTQFGGGGSVSSSMGSIPLVDGEPVGVQESSAGGLNGNQRNVLQVSISGLSDTAVLSGAQVRALLEQIDEARADGAGRAEIRMSA